MLLGSDIAQLVLDFIRCHLVEDQREPPHNFIGRTTHRDNDAVVGLARGEVGLGQCLKVGSIVGEKRLSLTDRIG
jgi:hypothetical protein